MRDLFADMIGKMLGERVTPALVIAAETGTWPGELWSEALQHGVLAAATPETMGGAGGSWNDAFVLIRATGWHAAPVPIAETIGANWLLGLAGIDASEEILTLGSTTDGHIVGGRFSGTIADAPWGTKASQLVTIARAGDVSRIVLLPIEDSAAQARNIAREPRDDLRYTDVAPIASAPLPKPLDAEAIMLCGAMIRSAQIAGAIARLLDMVLDYANQREQFGRPIGKYQAIQHQIARLAEQSALTAAAADAAFAASTSGPAPFAIAVAKAVASEAAGEAAGIAHAVMGAIGFTHEHAMHLFTRRLWSWRSEFGNQAFWAQRIGAAACERGSAELWPALVAGTLIR